MLAISPQQAEGLGLRVTRIRDHENLAHLEEDAKHLAAGILDPESFLNGYKFAEHTVEVVVRDASGKIKAIRRAHNLRTNTGGDKQAANMGGTAGNVAAYMALTTDTTAPAVGDTTLASEITTGGLARAQATYAHTNVSGSGSSTISGTYTLTYTWTASAAFTAVQKVGVFDASSSGNMWFENTFSSVNLSSGDTIQVTYTITY